MVKDINKITKIKKDEIKILLKMLINDGLVHQDGNLFYLRKKGIYQTKTTKNLNTSEFTN